MTAKHYFLITGSVTVVLQESEDAPVEIAQPVLNAVVTASENPYFGMEMIGRSTTALQMAYREKTKDTTGNIVDVAIHNVFYMGMMTPEEYTKRSAEGVKQDNVVAFAKDK